MNQSTSMTDEEIRVKALELMGWVRHESTNPDFAYVWKRGAEYAYAPPNYPFDPASALQLCDRMHSEGWTVEQIRRPGEDWIVSLFKGVIAGPSTTDPSLARAVTLCFLAAHSNEN